MIEQTVRIERITINNIKNVKHGEVSFSNIRRPEGASVLGVYGQNGSGKSALIDALEIVQQCMTGRKIEEHFAHIISVDEEYGKIVCELTINQPGNPSVNRVRYSLKLKKELEKPDETERQSSNKSDSRYALRVFDEELSIAIDDPNKKGHLTAYIDTSGNSPFKPETKYKELTDGDEKTDLELAVEKVLAYRESRSFVFSKLLEQKIQTKCKRDGDAAQLAKIALKVINVLGNFARIQMFVLNARDNGIISLDAMPLPFQVKKGKKIAGGGIILPMRGSETIPEVIYEAVNTVIDNMGIVLKELIPGLTVSLKKLGTEIMKDGETGVRVQLVSERDNIPIPLSCESEGIKRIVSFLHLLVLMYNNPSVTVVIDEIDSGVFEYLLGELLAIISSHGQGQLIFTCHNLRPLETIDRGFVAFTTTNPANRYIKMANVKSSNNLRDFYYRDIVLGGQKEQLYEPTNNGEIELAFIEAGVAREG